MIITNENLFLIALALIWIIGAVIQDLRRREVDNIWNFSLIGIALAYRLAVSVNTNYWFFINGLIGFLIFIILGNLFYYMRFFAGGDAKLLIALGTILPLSFDWLINLKILGYFILLFLLGGSIYAFIWSLFLIGFNLKNFGKEFVRQVKIKRNIFLISLVFLFSFLVLSYFMGFEFIFIGLIFLLFPFLVVFAKSVEECCMVKALSPEKITEGDWLYEDIFVKGRKIKANWEGVSKAELSLIRKKYRRKILVKQGIPFTPGFLIGFLALLSLDWFGWF